MGSTHLLTCEYIFMGVILASLLMLIYRLLYLNKRLEALAMTDSLTNLPNQRALVAALDQELGRAARYHHPFAVLFLDLNSFKAINDADGHRAGDVVLQEFARVVHSSLRQSDTLGRWEGDEFLVILPETEEAGAQRIAEHIYMAVAKHSFNGRHEFHLTCSIGIATYPFTAQRRELLIEAADQAMYVAKYQAHKQKSSAPAICVLKPGSSKLPRPCWE
jgi:diguanylate cyclase (GGDEF)-like protein